MAVGLMPTVDANNYTLIVGLFLHRERVSQLKAIEMARAISLALGDGE